jgi:inositol 1,4,5-triphosphate receptor-associated cGMP kinase
MEHPELSEQVVASVNGGSSVSSDASSTSTDVFPSLTNGVLQQLRLDAAASASDVFSDQDIENKFCALSLAFKTDKLTLETRHERQQRQRDQAERNMTVEIIELKAAVHRLNYVCKDSESIEILGRIQDQIDILQQSTELVSSSAEIFGAVQQEIRVSKAIEVMLTHVENLKRMFEKEHAELEETKRVLLENNLVLEGNADSADDSPKNPRHRNLISLSRQGKQKRRASIAVFRPLNSQDSTKTSNTSPTFGDTKRGVPHRRRSSSSFQADTPSPAWDRKDRLERPETVVGSMDGIKEMAEGWGNDSVNSDEQSTIMEENNNCTGIHKSSHCDSPPEVAGGDVTYSSGNTVKNPAQSGEANEDCTKDSSSPSLMHNLDSLRSFRDTAVEFVCRTHVTIVDSMTSLNTDYVLIQLRRCATVLLLFAAFWSLVSTFVPTTAQPRSCTPFSWLTLKDVLDKIAQLEHYGPPPT